MTHGTKPTVLIIEADRSMRRLIALGLQQRGMQIIEADSPTQLNIPEGQSPALLVLDIDSDANSDWSLLNALDTLPELSTIPIVVLTWEVLVPAGMPEDFVEERVTSLSKPFDARTLHATVEQLLVMYTAHRTGQTCEVQEAYTAGRTVSTAPSIWPLLTAVGLLLAFIGLMGQLSLIIIGLCIVLVSLLWWTLGTKPERAALPV
ncbi:MAG: response regulator [Ktedonobacteraceae bacterium]